MNIRLFDYTIDEINKKILEVEEIKRVLLEDLTQISMTIELMGLNRNNIDEFNFHKLNKSLKDHEETLLSLIEYYDLLISVYNEYIEATVSYFNYNKPHIIYEKDAKILSINKNKKGE